MARIEKSQPAAAVQNTESQSKPNQPTQTNEATAVRNETAGRASKVGELVNQGENVRHRLRAEAPPPAPPPDLATEASVNRVGGKVVIDAGAGDDRIAVNQDAKTGDVIVSVNGAERRFSGADRDNLVIRAGDGNDNVTVGNGVRVNLTLEGGNGNDTIAVDAGVTREQTIRGEAGDDNITGGGGADTIEAGAGNDTVNGGAGRDYINGSGGDDTLAGGDGDDVIYGGDGNDSIAGNAGNDYLEGSQGDDSIDGGEGSDVLSGGIGDDNLRGGAGDDALYAGQGRDNIAGGTGSNKIYAQTGTDTVEASDAPNGVNNTVVNVELVGNPGGLSVRVEGSPEFRERVEADLEMLRSSPRGREMLTAFDKSYTETRSRFAGVPLFGRMFNDGTTVTIRETSGGNTEQSVGRRNRADAVINYNTQRISLGGGGWQDRPPVVGLYHEMAHAYDSVNDTFAPGTYSGTDATNHGADNLERVAVGLPIDHDNDPKTPEIQDPRHPSGLTENALRDEMNLPRRPRY